MALACMQLLHAPKGNICIVVNPLVEAEGITVAIHSLYTVDLHTLNTGIQDIITSNKVMSPYKNNNAPNAVCS